MGGVLPGVPRSTCPLVKPKNSSKVVDWDMELRDWDIRAQGWRCSLGFLDPAWPRVKSKSSSEVVDQDMEPRERGGGCLVVFV